MAIRSNQEASELEIYAGVGAATVGAGMVIGDAIQDNEYSVRNRREQYVAEGREKQRRAQLSKKKPIPFRPDMADGVLGGSAYSEALAAGDAKKAGEILELAEESFYKMGPKDQKRVQGLVEQAPRPWWKKSAETVAKVATKL